MNTNSIKSFRLKLMLEQETFAKIIGVSRGAISSWERGIRNPSIAHIRKMKEIADQNKIKFKTEDLLNKKE